MAEYFGIDVAKWQGKINWAKVGKAKSFAILKVTKQNNTVEDSFETNYAGATKAGVPVGGYRYVYASTVAAAKAEAEAVVKILKGKSMPYGIWLDMEDKSIKKLARSKLTSIINAEAEILKANGFNVGIYCNNDWYNNVLDGKGLAKTYPFWIARYPAADKGQYNAKSTLSPKSYAVAWQYSSKGKVDGISGNVDLNILFKPISEIFPQSAAKTIQPKTTGYSQDKFIADVMGILRMSNRTAALNATPTISAKTNKSHALITPLERYMKSLGYYKGSIEADEGRTPVFGPGMTSAVVLYQKNVVKAKVKYQDGIISAHGTTWKKLLGLI